MEIQIDSRKIGGIQNGINQVTANSWIGPEPTLIVERDYKVRIDEPGQSMAAATENRKATIQPRREDADERE